MSAAAASSPAGAWLSVALGGVFVVLALWHVRMAFAPAGAGVTTGAVPSVDGRPLFVPSRGATLAVALALLLCAALVVTTGAIPASSRPAWLPAGLLGTLCALLALGLLGRAIGDFRYVGFFKRHRDGRFARLDTRLYSPLCLLLAAGVGALAWRTF